VDFAYGIFLHYYMETLYKQPGTNYKYWNGHNLLLILTLTQHKM